MPAPASARTPLPPTSPPDNADSYPASRPRGLGASGPRGLGASGPRGEPASARLTTGERDVGDAAGRAHRLDGEALLQALQGVPDGLAAAEEERNEREVHVVDPAGGEELADGGRA